MRKRLKFLNTFLHWHNTVPDICVYLHILARKRAVSSGGAMQGLRSEAGHIQTDGAGYTAPSFGSPDSRAVWRI